MSKENVALEPGYNKLSDDAYETYRKCIVPLFVIRDNELKCIGSGTLISSSGIIITARHVLQYAHDLGTPRAKDGRRYMDFDLYALVRTFESNPYVEGAELGGLVGARQLWMNDKLDIGYCILDTIVDTNTGKEIVYSHIPLNLKPPELNRRCIAFGFPGHDTQGGKSLDGMSYDYEEALYSADGMITEVYKDGRERGLYSFPCFTVNGQFEAGMSGGPIFTDGEIGITGIVSGGMDPAYSQGSIIWPSLGIKTNLEGDKMPKSIAEAVERNQIATVDNGYRVKILSEDEDEIVVSLQARRTSPNA